MKVGANPNTHGTPVVTESDTVLNWGGAFQRIPWTRTMAKFSTSHQVEQLKQDLSAHYASFFIGDLFEFASVLFMFKYILSKCA